MLLDSRLTPHLLEVNTRPSVYSEPLDRAVNRPLVQELTRLIGYHLPPDCCPRPSQEVSGSKTTHVWYWSQQYSLLVNCLSRQEELCSLLCLSSAQLPDSLYQPELYSRALTQADRDKQEHYTRLTAREQWLTSIAASLAPQDVKLIIKVWRENNLHFSVKYPVQTEEEVAACDQFDRIFPKRDAHQYHQYIQELTYYDKLLDAVEQMVSPGGDRTTVIETTTFFCNKATQSNINGNCSFG